MLKDIKKRRLYHNQYIKNRLKNDPEYKRKHNIIRKNTSITCRKRNRLILDEFRVDGCKLCGEKDPACLVAHHIDHTKKEFTIGTVMASMGESRFREELSKCVCLCANCHMKLHVNLWKDQKY